MLRSLPRTLAPLLCILLANTAMGESLRLKGLFLGDSGPHQPIGRAAELIPALAKLGIDVAYTENLNDLHPEYLRRFDCLILYANHLQISPEQERALIGYIEEGHGLVGIHCASFCFQNSPAFLQLLGGQFQHHDPIRRFTIKPVRESPAIRRVQAFETVDEPYVHHRLSDDRDVLMCRETPDGPEPWTWTRKQGKGRVFYTASGHDHRVFQLPEFHQLIAQGFRWAAGKPDFTWEGPTPKRVAAELPNYRQGDRSSPGRLHDMPLPLSAEDSMKHQSVPGGFQVELFAREPQIVKPIAINWDHRGRLWICESLDYPNDLQPAGAGNDRLTICEDTDSDGRADKFAVFAEKLSIPTSIIFANGGVIVAQAPDMLFLQDTDGDDVADVRKVLFTGFNTWDTHAGPSNLRYGLDHWIYGTVGYSGFDGEVGGTSHHFRQGIFRFKPDGSELEFLTSSSNNTWGLGFEESGEILYSTANGEHSSYLAIANRHFERVRGWLERGNGRSADHARMHPIALIRQVDFFDGFTAAAGHAIYTARHFPAPYHNQMALVCEPTGHLVHLCKLERRGSHYITRDRFNLFASSDEWTAPIAAEVGPDGAVWIIDWYNYIVQHNPIPPGFEKGKGNAYVTELRDKRHGRIYRVVDTVNPTSEAFELDKDDPRTLLAGLASDNMFWRLHAQRLFIERQNADVLDELAKLARNSSNPFTTIHALWTMHGLTHAKPSSEWSSLLVEMLRHSHPGVRKTAVKLLPRDRALAEEILAAGLLEDPDAIVQRETLLALQEFPASPAVGAALAERLSDETVLADRWLPLALTCASASHAKDFLLSVMRADREPTANASPNQEKRAEILRVVARHLARGTEADPLLAILRDLPLAAAGDADAVLHGLAAGWPDSSDKLPEDVEKAFVNLIPKLSSSSQLQLATLNRRWKSDVLEQRLVELPKSLLLVVTDERRPEADRVAAAGHLMELQPPAEIQRELLALANARTEPGMAQGILKAIERSGDSGTGQLVLSQWRSFTPVLKQQALELLMRRPEWTRSLLIAVQSGDVAVSELAADQVQRLSTHPNQELAHQARNVLTRSGALPNPDRQRVIEQMLPAIQHAGDVSRGKAVFEKTCAKCHQHGSMGTAIGPNLTGFAVHSKEKILAEVLDPNRSVEGNFRQYVVSTIDGQVISGLLASETRTALELIDSQAQKHIVLREDIENLVSSQKSIMPEGLEKELTTDQLNDLLEFLTAKGKFVPIPLDKVATVVTTRGMFHPGDDGPDRLIFEDWSPKTAAEVPFVLVDPRGGRPNGILLHGPWGTLPPSMPKSVELPCNCPATAIHLLSGISGWGYPAHREPTVSMIVRVNYADGETEEHPLVNGRHFADYFRRVDVPESQFAFSLGNQQLRYLSIRPKRTAPIRSIEFVKGTDPTAPIIMAVTIETGS